MINEHLLLAYAVQSKNRACINLVLAQRQWRFGGPIFARALEYADQNCDESLRSQLIHLYKFDEVFRTMNPHGSRQLSQADTHGWSRLVYQPESAMGKWDLNAKT